VLQPIRTPPSKVILKAWLLLCTAVFGVNECGATPTVEQILKEWDKYIEWASRLEGEVRYEETIILPNGTRTTSRIVSEVYLDAARNNMLIIARPEGKPAWVDGVNSEYRFTLSDEGVSEGKWEIENYKHSTAPRNTIGALNTTCQGFVLRTRMLSDILKAPDVRIEWPESDSKESSGALELQISEDSIKQGFRVQSGRLILDGNPPYLPQRFSGKLEGRLAMWDIEVTNAYEVCMNTPCIKRQDIQFRYPLPNGTRGERLERRDIQLAALSRTSDSDYRLTAFGLNEPLKPRTSAPSVLLIAINAAICAVLLLVVVYRARRATMSRVP
jgi:hypothetical protein